MSVWVLLMVLLAAPGGFDSSYQLNKFDSPGAYTDCMTERDRISADMRTAYPGDTSFSIECFDRSTPVTTRDEYDAIIKDFAAKRYPQEVLTINVINLKPLVGESGNLPIMALQIHISHKEGTHSFILLLKEKVVLGWIDAGEAEPDEEEEVDEFPAKDQA